MATLGQVKDALDKRDDQINSLKEDKIDKPSEAPAVGTILKVKSVNEDGTFTCEWDDGGSNLDVQINGKSIVQNNIAKIPIASARAIGVTSINPYYCGLNVENFDIPTLNIYESSQEDISNRRNMYTRLVMGRNIDAYVKAAITDGKGNAWTLEEKTSARERIGMLWTLAADITLAEPVQEFYVNLPDNCVDLIVSYTNPKNTVDTGSNYGSWLTLFNDTKNVIDCNWFNVMVNTTMTLRGYIKFEKISEDLYDIENASYGDKTVNDNYWCTHNGAYNKNNHSTKMGTFNKVKIREYGTIRFTEGSHFKIYVR